METSLLLNENLKLGSSVSDILLCERVYYILIGSEITTSEALLSRFL